MNHLATLAVTALALTAPAAMAQDAIKLKLSHVLPATHYLYEQGMKSFTDKVTAKTGGRVTFEVYPAAQLGKDFLGVLNSGLADVSLIISSYAPDKFPLNSVTELPGLYTTACEATAKFSALAQPGAPLDKHEFAPLGIRPVMVTILPSYRMMTVKKVETLADVSGLKIWGNGSAMDKTLRSLGAVPVRMPATELPDSVTRGTVDGASFPYSSLTQYGLQGAIRHSVEGTQLGSAGMALALSTRAWEALPEDVRTAMAEAGLEVEKELCVWLDADMQATRDRLTAEGFTVTTLSDNQAALWKETVAKVGEDWAAEMDANRKPGTELLEAMRATP